MSVSGSPKERFYHAPQELSPNPFDDLEIIDLDASDSISSALATSSDSSPVLFISPKYRPSRLSSVKCAALLLVISILTGIIIGSMGSYGLCHYRYVS